MDRENNILPLRHEPTPISKWEGPHLSQHKQW